MRTSLQRTRTTTFARESPRWHTNGGAANLSLTPYTAARNRECDQNQKQCDPLQEDMFANVADRSPLPLPCAGDWWTRRGEGTQLFGDDECVMVAAVPTARLSWRAFAMRGGFEQCASCIGSKPHCFAAKLRPILWPKSALLVTLLLTDGRCIDAIRCVDPKCGCQARTNGNRKRR